MQTTNTSAMKQAGPNQFSDEVVISRVLKGEKELFEILLRRYNQLLFRTIRSYLRDRDEIQDVMQNTYLKAFDKLYQFHGTSSFATWLIRIGINEALLHLKTLRRGNQIFLDSHTREQTLHEIPDREMNPQNVMMHHEAKKLLEEAIDRLPEKYRVIYVLKEVEGLPNEHVQEALGLGASNVKVRLHRAKSLLKESLLTLSAAPGIFEFGKGNCDSVVAFVMRNI